MTDDTPRDPLGMEDAADSRSDDAATYTTEDEDTDASATRHRRRDGIELRVTMVDWNRRDADGNPHAITSREVFSLYELARMDNMSFANRALELAGRRVIGEFRSAANIDGEDEGDA